MGKSEVADSSPDPLHSLTQQSNKKDKKCILAFEACSTIWVIIIVIFPSH